VAKGAIVKLRGFGERINSQEIVYILVVLVSALRGHGIGQCDNGSK
jgi:hypothetical protein